jgi:hypothetical protein
MKFEFSGRIFGKVSNVKIYQNPSRGSRVVPCGETDGHDEANSRFPQFLRTRLKRSNLDFPNCVFCRVLGFVSSGMN